MDSDKKQESEIETVHAVQNQDSKGMFDTTTLSNAPKMADAISSRNEKDSSSSGDLREDFTDKETVEVTILIPFEKVGLVIGRSGRNIKSIQEKTSTRMHIVQEKNGEDVDQRKRTLIITGTKEDVVDAEKLVNQLLTRTYNRPTSGQQEFLEDSPASDVKDRRSKEEAYNGRQKRGYKNSVQIPVPSIAMGLIIGRGGETIKKIRNTSGAKIQFHPSSPPRSNDDVEEHLAIVTGNTHQIRYACDLIEGLITTALVSDSKGRPRGGRGRNRVFQGTSRWGPCIHGEDEPIGSTSPSGSMCAQVAPPSRQNPTPDGETDPEEDKITLTAEEFQILVKDYQDLPGFIHEVSGATCALVEGPTSEKGECGGGKTLFLIGFHHQIRYAKDLVAQILSNDQAVKSGEVKNYSDGTPHHSSTKGSFEWGQGEPAGYHWNPSYYDPAGLIGNVRMEQHSHPALGYAYPGYCHPPYMAPFHPEILNIPPPHLDTNKPGHASVDPEAPAQQQPIPPVPIMSATVVQTPDPSGQFLGPPVIYFSLPQVPVVNLGQKYRETEHSSVDPTLNPCDENNNKDAQANSEVKPPECKNLEASQVEMATLEDAGESPNQEEAQPSAPPPPSDGLNSGSTSTGIPEVNFNNPQVLGVPGSHARIVTFYYDLNVNSVVIMNQWQQF